MKIIAAINANSVKCDVAGCGGQFYSYSLHSLIRKQARNEGWARRRRSRVMEHFGLTADQLSGGRMVDVCPEHVPPGRARSAR